MTPFLKRLILPQKGLVHNGLRAPNRIHNPLTYNTLRHHFQARRSVPSATAADFAFSVLRRLYNARPPFPPQHPPNLVCFLFLVAY